MGLSVETGGSIFYIGVVQLVLIKFILRLREKIVKRSDWDDLSDETARQETSTLGGMLLACSITYRKGREAGNDSAKRESRDDFCA